MRRGTGAGALPAVFLWSAVASVGMFAVGDTGALSALPLEAGLRELIGVLMFGLAALGAGLARYGWLRNGTDVVSTRRVVWGGVLGAATQVTMALVLTLPATWAAVGLATSAFVCGFALAPFPMVQTGAMQKWRRRSGEGDSRTADRWYGEGHRIEAAGRALLGLGLASVALRFGAQVTLMALASVTTLIALPLGVMGYLPEPLRLPADRVPVGVTWRTPGIRPVTFAMGLGAAASACGSLVWVSEMATRSPLELAGGGIAAYLFVTWKGGAWLKLVRRNVFKSGALAGAAIAAGIAIVGVAATWSPFTVEPAWWFLVTAGAGLCIAAWGLKGLMDAGKLALSVTEVDVSRRFLLGQTARDLGTAGIFIVGIVPLAGMAWVSLGVVIAGIAGLSMLRRYRRPAVHTVKLAAAPVSARPRRHLGETAVYRPREGVITVGLLRVVGDPLQADEQVHVLARDVSGKLAVFLTGAADRLRIIAGGRRERGDGGHIVTRNEMEVVTATFDGLLFSRALRHLRRLGKLPSLRSFTVADPAGAYIGRLRATGGWTVIVAGRDLQPLGRSEWDALPDRSRRALGDEFTDGVASVEWITLRSTAFAPEATARIRLVHERDRTGRRAAASELEPS